LAGADVSSVDVEELEERLRALCTPWIDQFEAALSVAYDRDTALRFQRELASSLSEPYQRTTSPQRAVRDVEMLDKVVRTGEMRFDFFEEPEDSSARHVRLRIYHRGDTFLSDILPILDHF